MNEIQAKINAELELLGVEQAIRGISWNGYEVYIPDTSKLGTYIGYPYVILVKGEEVRTSTPEESLEYLDYEQMEKSKSKNIGALKDDQIEEV